MIKKLLIVLILLSIPLLTVVSNPLTAITEEGRTVLLNSDGTWEQKYEKKISNDLEVMDEQNLYTLVLRENDIELCKHYLEHYEGVDIKNTINVLFNEIMCMTMSMESTSPLYKEILLKGIQYTYQYEKIFMMRWRVQDIVSNLFFFWELATTLESNKQYEEALSYFEKLKEIYMETNMSYPYSWILGENTLEEIDGKIYKMKYLMTQ